MQHAPINNSARYRFWKFSMGDAPEVVREVGVNDFRVPGTDLHMYGTLWLLTQGETRKTKRVRLFTEFVSRRLAAYAPLLAGLSISRD
jgi:hypothetical protein